ncbi:ATP-binding protein [Streptomyces atacamensis]|uniref:ATP-binding protein n=1 Tax=Streptomyces atacamensis TaxID=531966 RepID=UPI00399C9E70
MDLLTGGSEDAGAPRARADFDGLTSTVAQARDTADTFLTALARTTPPARDRNRDDVLLVVSELVTNAVRHAPGPFTLCLAPVPGGVRVTVRDTSTTLPRPRTPDVDGGAGGFGCPIVQCLAHRLEALPHQDGKEIHAVLPW